MNELSKEAMKSLGATPDIVDIISREDSIIAPIRAKREAATKESAAFEAERERSRLGIERGELEKKSKALVEKRQEIETSPEFQKAKEIDEDMMGAAFIPTKETAGDMAQLFALINIAGFALGAGGKQNSQAAMSAMNGMLEGYQKGRSDLYKKEKDIFLNNVKALENKRKILRDRLSELSQRADLSVSQKNIEARMDALQQGADFIAANIEKFGLPNTIKLLEQQETDARRRMDTVRKELQRAEEKKQTALYRQQMIGSRQPAGKGQIFQDAQSGKMYSINTATGDVTEVQTPPGSKLLPMSGKSASAGQNALTFASRVYGNIENAAADLADIVALPQTAELPIFSGLLNVERATSLGSLESLAGRAITAKENRAFQQVSDQLGAALSRMESQGLASGATKASIASFNSLRPGPGDNAINMALYIARVKQEIQTGVRVHDKMPGATAEQKAATKQILEQLDKVVPFDVNDVLSTLRKKKQPLSDKMTKLVSAPPVANGLALGDTQTPPAPETRVTPPSQTSNIENERAAAKAAISAGKDEDAVKRRFKERTGQEL